MLGSASGGSMEVGSPSHRQPQSARHREVPIGRRSIVVTVKALYGSETAFHECVDQFVPAQWSRVRQRRDSARRRDDAHDICGRRADTRTEGRLALGEESIERLLYRLHVPRLQ
jgi:hypothetical protein